MDTDVTQNQPTQEGGWIDTIQSLVVAFVLAMTFRGFVVEGFVIPTGSMAPTLLGEHWLVRSEQTGYEVSVGLDGSSKSRPDPGRLQDAALGRGHPLDGTGPLVRRIGDRILVVKYIWPFFQPDRFDVAVFKNPTEPEGPSGNYIKRVIGLPGETVWLVDGDIFVRNEGEEKFTIRRKPEHVQRVVWQQVWSSNEVPSDPSRLSRRWAGPPWSATPAKDWDLEAKSTFTCSTDAPSELRWDMRRYPLDDWTAYNMLSPPGQRNLKSVRDLRIEGTIFPKKSGFMTTMEIQADRHVFQYRIDGSTASVSMWPSEDDASKVTRTVTIEPLQVDRGTSVRFQRSDQSMSLWMHGRKVVELDWDWSPQERLAYVTGTEDPVKAMSKSALPPIVTWNFSGAPFTLTNMSMARDLFYRTGLLHSRMKNAPQKGYEDLVKPGTPGYGTDPRKLAVLESGQYFVLGDNSARSLDSRLWGAPHPYVAEQIDAMPFVVDRRLLIGKAWVVYYPAPHALRPGSSGLIPDFGKIRFIR